MECPKLYQKLATATQIKRIVLFSNKKQTPSCNKTLHYSTDKVLKEPNPLNRTKSMVSSG